MDPITAAIVAVLPALGANLVESGVKDAYAALKAIISSKWGAGAPVSKAIAAIEEDPNSKAQAAVLDEKVRAVKASEDADVAQALRQLIEQMKAQGVAHEAIAKIQFTMSGGTVQGVAGADNVRIGTMNFGVPPKK